MVFLWTSFFDGQKHMMFGTKFGRFCLRLSLISSLEFKTYNLYLNTMVQITTTILEPYQQHK